jgi:DNA-binding NarL/FixJ family response regulator
MTGTRQRLFRILIVEDHVQFRDALHRALQEHFPFIEYEEAGDVHAAEQIAGRFRPDLIFVDIRLPGESGLEFTRRLKASCNAAKVIMLTGYDLPEYKREAKSCGADHYLVKGKCRHSDIVALVESMVQ